ncbi:hypothetical protein SeMB42_g05988 [Synchytrium endobioticum]|nr:hypothetical protein SeMB42_g05988 [Synchytrium endobioticum]
MSFRPMPGSAPPAAPLLRIPELLDALKVEFDALAQDHSVYKMQRDDHDHKITAQMNELAAFQQSLYELERAHQKMKQLYEEEIIRLRRELEARGIPPPPSILIQDNRARSNPALPENVPPPVLASTGSGAVGSVFGALMAGAAPMDQRPPYVNGGADTNHNVKRIRGEDGVPVIRDIAATQGPMNPYTPPLSASYPMTHSQLPHQQLPSYLTKPGAIGPPQQQPPLQSGPLSSQINPNKDHNNAMQSSHATAAAMGGPMANLNNNLLNAAPPYATPPATNNELKRKQPSNNGGNGAGKPLPQVASSPASQSSVATPVYNQPLTGLCDLSLETAQPGWKKEGPDWLVLYNHSSPALQRSRVSVDMLHSLDHGSVVCCVRFSTNGKYVATGCNRMAQIFDAVSGERISTLIDANIPKEGDLYIRSVCFSPDGTYLATGAEDRIIRIWDIAQKKIRWTLTGHDQDIYSLDWSSDGKVVVSGSGDRSVKIWDMETGKCLLTMQNEEDRFNRPAPSVAASGLKDSGVTSVAVSPLGGQCVAAGSLDRIVRVWCLRTGALLERFEGHRDSVYSVSFSPDGRSLVSGSLDKTIKVWNLDARTLAYLTRSSTTPADDRFESITTTTCRHTYAGHRDFVLSVAFAGAGGPIGRVDERGEVITGPVDGVSEVEWVVSGSKDRTVSFWDARPIGPGGRNPDLAAAAQFVLQGHKNSVISIALAPSGGLFATGSGDWKTRIWRLSVASNSSHHHYHYHHHPHHQQQHSLSHPTLEDHSWGNNSNTDGGGSSNSNASHNSTTHNVPLHHQHPPPPPSTQHPPTAEQMETGT